MAINIPIMILSKLPTINCITYDNIEINIIYNKIGDENIMIKSMMELPCKIQSIVSNFDNFCKKYCIVRKIMDYKKLVGNKYGYLNGIAVLLLVLNIYLKNQELSDIVFTKTFFEYYSTYDWKTPINIFDYPIDMVKRSYCDKYLTIIDILPPHLNVVRNITDSTWKIILEEFNLCASNFTKEFLNKRRELPIYGDMIYIEIPNIELMSTYDYLKKKRFISSQIHKCIRKTDCVPNTTWSIVKNDNNVTLRYKIFVTNIDDTNTIINRINDLKLNINCYRQAK